MVRTVISLDESDKHWLDRKAAEEGVPMTQIVREAVQLLRQQDRVSSRELERLVEQTSGLWKQGDGLVYQERLRGEW